VFFSIGSAMSSTIGKLMLDMLMESAHHLDVGEVF